MKSSNARIGRPLCFLRQQYTDAVELIASNNYYLSISACRENRWYESCSSLPSHGFGLDVMKTREQNRPPINELTALSSSRCSVDQMFLPPLLQEQWIN